MVIRKRALSLALIPFVLFLTSVLIPLATVKADTVSYTVNQEWVQIWINKDGSIDIQYNITLTYTAGSPEGIVTVGMPKGGFEIYFVRDLSGKNLTYKDVSHGDFYGIEVELTKPIVLNKPYTFLVYAVVPGMISQDWTNLGNEGMRFYPTTFPSASGPIEDLRVIIVLPEGVKIDDNIKYLTSTPFDDKRVDPAENRVVVYWERSNWPAAKEFWVGVSYRTIWFYVFIGLGVLGAVILSAAVLMMFRKATYEKPRIAIEALGAARGLTAVEAGVVLDLKPVRVLTMILFGLLLKRVVMVTAVDPVIKLQKLERPVGEPAPSLRYYEISYLDALEPDGSLNEMKLARTYLELKETVDLKLRSFSRADTVNYYKSIVNKAWEQVTQAGTPELKGDAIDKNIEWLLADDRFDERLRIAFPPDIIIYPRPDWWWYWHGPHFPPGQRPVPPTTPTESKPIPGQDFANNIVRGLEIAANNVVRNVQEFSNRLIPVRPVAARERSVRSQSSCICACAHCACACACVSCACACAHGGAR